MAEIILDGKNASGLIRQSIEYSIKRAVEAGSRRPELAIVRMGDDPASDVYVRQKEKACAEVGIGTTVYSFGSTASPKDVRKQIRLLNVKHDVDGILLQLPLPKPFIPVSFIEAIDPAKDVDGLTVQNCGHWTNPTWNSFQPCTPSGICTLLRWYGIQTEGAHAVIVGRSQLVGRPLAMMLSDDRRNATVTLCNSHTRDLAQLCRSADILISAVGSPKFITAEMVKPGATVVDVGINRGSDGKLCGDVDFDNVAPLAHAITPVPGGVGPMTVTTLLENVEKAWNIGAIYRA